ncbi:hypothetical protein BDZ90DRAFT_122658 [Jaminaea rosea]|uniref:Uncharacterized protein n=1 Tax=Jaminaea rosea TaxID=1569628 RepID=A0A316UJ60_9BASI|nr:hypothetical protein BDZ90DRAFT_122658 [Jaminaea rosea]PWN24381.1 hypothetical protein BDZ90DRAFT_122658 [Jaminaea rosea]
MRAGPTAKSSRLVKQQQKTIANRPRPLSSLPLHRCHLPTASILPCPSCARRSQRPRISAPANPIALSLFVIHRLTLITALCCALPPPPTSALRLPCLLPSGTPIVGVSAGCRRRRRPFVPH